MKLLRLDLKKLLDKNALLMSFMAFICTIIALYFSSNQNQEINSATNILKIDGSQILFVMFGVELSKSTLVIDKINKKLEFLLANGISIKRILGKYSCSIYLATVIIILPCLVLNLLKLGISLIVVVSLIISSIFYSLIIILSILYTRNMNKINSLQIKLVLLSIMMITISMLVYNFTNMISLYFVSKIFILGSISLILGIGINKERIVASYY